MKLIYWSYQLEKVSKDQPPADMAGLAGRAGLAARVARAGRADLALPHTLSFGLQATTLPHYEEVRQYLPLAVKDGHT